MGAPAKFRDAAIDMALRGVRPGVIAQLCEVAPDVIYQLLKDARRKGVEIPRFAGGPVPGAAADGGNQVRFRVNQHCLPALDRAAAAREMTRPQLMRRLLEVLVEDGLIDSVMDDGVSSD